MFSHPAHFIAFGFGTGLAPVGPGTFGTVLAFPLYFGLVSLIPEWALITCIALFFAIGVWACHVTGRHLGVHDHGGMVWDEVVAFMLVLLFVPAQPYSLACAFLLFRLFDIYKPPPIRSLDLGIRNGFGVMFDDIVAAFYALLCLAVWFRFQEWSTQLW